MASSTDQTEGYIFNRNFRSSIRLNLNHWIFKGLAGYLLHPSVEHADHVTIADIGTGTAIWLQELAEQLPSSAELYGFDNSPEQYPAKQWLLPNVNLIAHDCFQTFPDEYFGKFDVVHIRAFRCIIKNNDPAPFVENLAKLLKPGGYLQWFDVLGKESHVTKPHGAASTPAMDQIAKMSVLPASDLPADWVGELPATLSKSGFDVLASDHIPYRNAYRLPWAQSVLAGIEDMSSKATGDKAKQAQGMIDALSHEIGHGVVMEHPCLCVVAQKHAV